MTPGTRVKWTEEREYLRGDGALQNSTHKMEGKVVQVKESIATIKLGNGTLRKRHLDKLDKVE